MGRTVVGLLLVLASGALGDVVHLKDGTTIEGTVKRVEDQYVITAADGSKRQISADKVDRIDLGNRSQSAARAESKLYSLRRSVESLDDLDRIIARFEQFIEQNAGTPLADEARKDLELWTDRLERGLVKHGDEWVTPEERDARLGESMLAVGEARELLRQERVGEARRLLDAVLRVDPRNAAAQYLRGVAMFKQDELQGARKAFDAANALVAGHSPTLNNLAVTCWRQNQWGAVLSFFDQALTPDDADPVVVDNVAELLHMLPSSHRETAITKRVTRKFQMHERRLVQFMADRGLYRWGAVWLDEKQRAKVLEQREAMKTKLTELSQQFDEAQANIRRIEQDIETNLRSMREMEARSWVVGPDGTMYRARLPSVYYEIKRDNERLAHERDREIARRNSIRDAAKQITERLDEGTYTGSLRIIGVEGTPMAPEALAPSTQPTTREAE
jgi:tetratricopeptide (TPR) repeat protein